MRILTYLLRLSAWLYRYLIVRNDNAVAEWSASLQHRRYTNPEDAKRFRRAPLRGAEIDCLTRAPCSAVAVHARFDALFPTMNRTFR